MIEKLINTIIQFQPSYELMKNNTIKKYGQWTDGIGCGWVWFKKTDTLTKLEFSEHYFIDNATEDELIEMICLLAIETRKSWEDMFDRLYKNKC